MKFQFDFRIDDLGGVYRCEKCNTRFYDEEKPAHSRDCPAINNSDNNIVYRYGPQEVIEVLSTGESRFSRLKISDLSVEARESVAVRESVAAVGVECMCG